DMPAAGVNRASAPRDGLDILAADALVLLDEIGHRVMDAFQLGAGNIGVPRLLRATAIENRVEPGEKLRDRLVDPDIHAAMEGDPFAFHLLHARVDEA